MVDLESRLLSADEMRERENNHVMNFVGEIIFTILPPPPTTSELAAFIACV
jgi:hypothetical protein